jgi:hypothetical protein
MTFARYELRIHTPGGDEVERLPQGAFERLSYERRLNAVLRANRRMRMISYS